MSTRLKKREDVILSVLHENGPLLHKIVVEKCKDFHKNNPQTPIYSSPKAFLSAYARLEKQGCVESQMMQGEHKNRFYKGWHLTLKGEKYIVSLLQESRLEQIVAFNRANLEKIEELSKMFAQILKEWELDFFLPRAVIFLSQVNWKAALRDFQTLAEGHSEPERTVAKILLFCCFHLAGNISILNSTRGIPDTLMILKDFCHQEGLEVGVVNSILRKLCKTLNLKKLKALALLKQDRLIPVYFAPKSKEMNLISSVMEEKMRDHMMKITLGMHFGNLRDVVFATETEINASGMIDGCITGNLTPQFGEDSREEKEETKVARSWLGLTYLHLHTWKEFEKEPTERQSARFRAFLEEILREKLQVFLQEQSEGMLHVPLLFIEELKGVEGVTIPPEIKQEELSNQRDRALKLFQDKKFEEAISLLQNILPKTKAAARQEINEHLILNYMAMNKYDQILKRFPNINDAERIFHLLMGLLVDFGLHDLFNELLDEIAEGKAHWEQVAEQHNLDRPGYTLFFNPEVNPTLKRVLDMYLVSLYRQGQVEKVTSLPFPAASTDGILLRQLAEISSGKFNLDEIKSDLHLYPVFASYEHLPYTELLDGTAARMNVLASLLPHDKYYALRSFEKMVRKIMEEKDLPVAIIKFILHLQKGKESVQVITPLLRWFQTGGREKECEFLLKDLPAAVFDAPAPLSDKLEALEEIRSYYTKRDSSPEIVEKITENLGTLQKIKETVKLALKKPPIE